MIILDKGKYFHSYIVQSNVTLFILIIREIISNYLEEQSEPQPTFGRLLPIEEEKLEDGITEITQNDVKLDMKEENPFSCQEFKHKKHELSESCHSNLYIYIYYVGILLLVLIEFNSFTQRTR